MLERSPICNISTIEFYIVINDYIYINLSTYARNNLSIYMTRIYDWYEKVKQNTCKI